MYRSRPGSRGLGAYPTDCFYDPNRPGWLPYFIDTQTESQAKLACFYGVAPKNVTAQQIINPTVAYPPLSVPPSPAGPSTVAQETIPGQWTPDQAIAEADTEMKQQNLDFFKNLDKSLNPQSNPTRLSTTALIALGLAAGAVLLLATSGGRRR